MTPAEARAFANEALTEHGLHDWLFLLNTTSKRAAGWCKYDERSVELAEWVFDLGWPEEAIKDVILHEVAHALTPRDEAHGPEWKRVAQRIGADPSRTYSGLPSMRAENWVWREHCLRCGWERFLFRLSGYGSCARCGSGSFDPDLLVAIESRDGRPVTAKTTLYGYTKHDALDLLPAGTEGL